MPESCRALDDRVKALFTMVSRRARTRLHSRGELCVSAFSVLGRDPAASHTRPAGVFRDEPEIRQAFARMSKSREVTEFGDHAHRGGERDPRNA